MGQHRLLFVYYDYRCIEFNLEFNLELNLENFKNGKTSNWATNTGKNGLVGWSKIRSKCVARIFVKLSPKRRYRFEIFFSHKDFFGEQKKKKRKLIKNLSEF